MAESLPPQAVVFRVADDADDFITGTSQPVCASCRFAKLFPERIFLAKVFLDEGLIHDHRSRRGSWSASAVRSGKLEIGSVEAAAGEEWNVQGLEEIRPDAKHVRFSLLILGPARSVDHGYHQPVTPQRHHRVAGGLHARR